MNVNEKKYFINHKKRIEFTYSFLSKHISKEETITDLGEENVLSQFLKNKGYKIQNTQIDLDLGIQIETNVITAFEVFEHMFSPFNVLNNNSGKLICSVPLRYWFKSEYWNNDDPKDCHYHEFSVRQFNHLLNRTGWKIKESELKKVFNFKFGVRPILKQFYPRYYFVYAVK